jgi:hypothetical protein
MYHHHHVTQSSHSINAIGPAPLWSGRKREHCSIMFATKLCMYCLCCVQAALKCRGPGCATNFPCERYADLLGSLSSMTLEELIMAVRRQSQVRSCGSGLHNITPHVSRGCLGSSTECRGPLTRCKYLGMHVVNVCRCWPGVR